MGWPVYPEIWTLTSCSARSMAPAGRARTPRACRSDTGASVLRDAMRHGPHAQGWPDTLYRQQETVWRMPTPRCGLLAAARVCACVRVASGRRGAPCWAAQMASTSLRGSWKPIFRKTRVLSVFQLYSFCWMACAELSHGRGLGGRVGHWPRGVCAGKHGQAAWRAMRPPHL